MAAGNWQSYDTFKQYITDGTIDFNSNTLKLALVSSSYTFSLSHSIYTDLTNELATAIGYTAGGFTVTSAVASPSSNAVILSIGTASWNVSGGTLTARRAVLYVSTTVNTIVKPLIGSFLLDGTPADVSVTTGNTLTITGGTVFSLGGATAA